MTEEPTIKSDQARPQDSRTTGEGSGSNVTSSPSSNPTYGDPARRPIGDKVEDQSKSDDQSRLKDAADHAASLRAAARSQSDGGEGHAGPKVDATHVAANSPSNQPKQTLSPSAPQTDGHAKSDSACSSSSDETKPMPALTQSGASSTV